jgi:hypothetical protein
MIHISSSYVEKTQILTPSVPIIRIKANLNSMAPVAYEEDFDVNKAKSAIALDPIYLQQPGKQ